MKQIKNFLQRILISIKIVLLFFFILFFLVLAGILASPIILLSIPWYVINGKGPLHFFNETVINENKNK